MKQISWREPAQRGVRTALVIVPSPRVDLAPGIRQRQEPMEVQAFVAEPAIEGLHEGVFGRFSRAREVQRYAGDCQDFRVWPGIMGNKESHYVTTQRTCHTE